MKIYETVRQQLLYPTKLYRRDEVLSKPSPVPNTPGIYAWYFKNFLDDDIVQPCHQQNDFYLFYVGISPSSAPKEGKISQSLRKRIRNHLRGNAAGSTLRLSLGCLNAESLGIQLRLVGNSGKMNFTPEGEAKLNQWLDENAFVTWVETPEPWVVEPLIIQSLSLPLNLDHNRNHPFYPKLSQIRRQAREAARSLPGFKSMTDETFFYLITTGHKSGKPHEIEIWFVEHEGCHYLCAEHGERAHWVQNILKNPRVQFRIGANGAKDTSWIEGHARVVSPTVAAGEDANLHAEVSRRFDEKYNWSDGLFVEICGGN